MTILGRDKDTDIHLEPAVPRRPRPAVRRDIQGIRGLGIIFVVVGHLWRWPPGVYAMLDMFFVLSGFLITGVLIDSVNKYGGISFAQFYLSLDAYRASFRNKSDVIVVDQSSEFFKAMRGSGFAAPSAPAAAAPSGKKR